jgi:hypothetical protein
MSQQPRHFRTVECLEDRSLLSVFGVPWPDGDHLTLSFVPDGTTTAMGPSDLFSTLDATGTPSAWETEILRAYQTWAVNANINIGLVADGGQALGTPGAVQGDPRFGDIRVVAAATHSAEVSSGGPFSWVGSTLAGDVLFDDSKPFSIGNVPGDYDLFSVALHEAGHSLGLDSSTAPGSAMNDNYYYHTGLSAGDIANLQALYGARTPDAFDAAHSNDTRAQASALPMQQLGVDTRYVANGDLSSLNDVDYYKFTALPLYNSVTLHLQAKGLSLVLPEVTVYDASGREIASGLSVDPLNNDVTLKFNAPLLGGSYTVKVDGATNDVFGIGAYRLTVDNTLLGGTLPVLPALLSPVVDGLLNNTLATATTLLSVSPNQTDQRFDAVYRGSIDSANDTDYFKIRAPLTSPGGPTNLNVLVWGLDLDPLDPVLHLFDSAGNPIAFEVLANQSGLMSVQLQNITPGQYYYIEVAARNPGGANGTGTYMLGADFNQTCPVTPEWVAGDTLAPATTETGTLTVSSGEGAMYQFLLSAQSTGAGVVGMTIVDASGNTVLSLNATAGQPLVTGVTYLAEGTYTVKYTYLSGIAPIRYDLLMLQLSDDIGPYATTTTSTASSPPPPPPSSTGYTYSGPSSPPPKPTYYYF